jgi:hypothetical protein
MILSVTPAESSPWRSSLQLINAHTPNHGPPRQGLPSAATRPKGPRTSSSARLPPSTSQRTPPASSLRHRTTRSCHGQLPAPPNFDSACPTADGEFATIRHQPWDFATWRGTLHLLCTFSTSVSYCDALTCNDANFLTQCHLAFVSDSCPFFRTHQKPPRQSARSSGPTSRRLRAILSRDSRN